MSECDERQCSHGYVLGDCLRCAQEMRPEPPASDPETPIDKRAQELLGENPHGTLSAAYRAVAIEAASSHTELRALAADWKEKAKKSREEAGRIRRTVYVATEAEANCYIRAEVWDTCAAALEAALGEKK